MIAVLTQRTLKVLAMQMVKYRKSLYGTKLPPREIYYFGYGANLNVERFQKYSMNVETVGPAKISGYALSFSLPCEYKGKGFASIDPMQAKEVWGILYKMDRLSLSLLDIMEWAVMGHYKKITVQVETSGKTVEAIAYQANHPQSGRLPSVGYKESIIRSSREHGFPESYIKEIESTPAKEKFPLDPGYSLLFTNRRRIFEEQLKSLYLAHDRLREKVCDWLKF